MLELWVECFSLYYSLYSIFDSGILPVVSVCGCTLVKPNHINIGVLCDKVIFILLFSASLGF